MLLSCHTKLSATVCMWAHLEGHLLPPADTKCSFKAFSYFHFIELLYYTLPCLFSPGALEFPIWILDFTYNVTRFRHIITFHVVPFESDSSLGACGSVCIKNFFSVNPWLVKTSPYFIVEACNSSFFSHLLQLVGLFLSMLSILWSSNFAVLHIQD